MTINVISQEIARSRENKVYTTVPKPKVQKKEKSKKSEYHLLFWVKIPINCLSGKKVSNEESDLPEVDQNTNKTLRHKQKVK